MKNFMEKYNVSRETFDCLKTYEASLNEWQQKFNLVSKNSLADAWNRHFADSAQLFDYIPKEAEVLLDFGSGAGFPGMVLAIMAKEKTPYLKVKLIESIGKKTLYLNTSRKSAMSMLKSLIRESKRCRRKRLMLSLRAPWLHWTNC